MKQDEIKKFDKATKIMLLRAITRGYFAKGDFEILEKHECPERITGMIICDSLSCKREKL